MAGVKGRSGRRTLAEEVRKHALINDCYEVTHHYVKTAAEPLKERAVIASGIVRVDIGKDVHVQGEISHTVKVVKFGDKK